MWRRDAKQQTSWLSYDLLQRPVHIQVNANGQEYSAERMIYGEEVPQAEQQNLRGQLYQHYDQAGLLETELYSFESEPKRVSRRLCSDYQTEPDWQDGSDWSAALETEAFVTFTHHDALGRVVEQDNPDSSRTVPRYHPSGWLQGVQVRLSGQSEYTEFIQNIEYNPKGQRERVIFGNGVSSTYEYDSLTYRLEHIRTARNSDNTLLQDLRYTYDPVGNITLLRDNAQQEVFFNNAQVSADGRYRYDALYRLTEAEGREHPGQQPTHEDLPRTQLPHPNDGQALQRYTEQYFYDEVGNIERMKHTAPIGGWTRRYSYASDSNRLLSTSLPGDPEEGPYSATYAHDENGNMSRMPHLQEMDWDHADRMRRVDLGGGGTAYYVYDGEGQRVRKVVERNASLVQEHIYLGGYEVYRQHLGSVLDFERQTLHVMDDQRRIALVETKTVEDGVPLDAPVPRQRVQLDNHLGSSLMELDSIGQVITYEEYFPFGGTAYHSARSGVEVSAKRYRYNGKERDEESGLYYYGARYYAPWLGRWIAPDPIGLEDGTNLYVYVSDTPMRNVDPNGTSESEWTFGGFVSKTWRETKEGILSAKQKIKETAAKSGDFIMDIVEQGVMAAEIENTTAREAIMTGAAVLATATHTVIEGGGELLMAGPNLMLGIESAGTKLGEGAAKVVTGDVKEGLKEMADITGLITAGENLGEGAAMMVQGDIAKGGEKFAHGVAGGAGNIALALGVAGGISKGSEILSDKVPRFKTMKGPGGKPDGWTLSSGKGYGSKPRLEYHTLPKAPMKGAKGLAKMVQGKKAIHYHRRGPGGIGLHRPWQTKPSWKIKDFFKRF